jgi:hypothetical protein
VPEKSERKGRRDIHSSPFPPFIKSQLENPKLAETIFKKDQNPSEKENVQK